jgi:hypothetical protein
MSGSRFKQSVGRAGDKPPCKTPSSVDQHNALYFKVITYHVRKMLGGMGLIVVVWI